MSFNEIEGGVLAAESFVAAAENCGIKPDELDLVLLHSQLPAVAAATITSNRFRAAPTFVTEQAVADGRARTVVANSGSANCATGERGLADARRMAQLAAETTGVDPDEAIVCSTGHIGRVLPMDKIAPGIKRLGSMLSRDNAEQAARGIMTTDTHPKTCAVELDIGGVPCRIGGIAKGAGMICPDMATMLCFVCTDVAIEPGVLKRALNWCVERSFNCISADGCMSTNDTVAILANGAAGTETINDETEAAYESFRGGLLHITQQLAKQIAFDGEGSTKDITIRVLGAESFEQARGLARAVANYNLLKTSMYGRAFNWGRVAAAMGASGTDIDPGAVTIRIQGITAWHDGDIVEYDEAVAEKAMASEKIEIEIDMGCGEARATVWTCDLTHDYVRVNME